MDFGRIARHLSMTHWRVRRAFPRATLAAIERAIRESEAAHAGEIRFAVEGALDLIALLRGQTPRERAIEVFSMLRIWDTEYNNGVLIYLLLADHAVEIVADRGVHSRVGTDEWTSICRQMERTLSLGQYEAAVVNGIHAVTQHLIRHYPRQAADINELPDQPVVI
jgi:uncharacterized membrane protein